jgi:hypothetical protein
MDVWYTHFSLHWGLWGSITAHTGVCVCVCVWHGCVVHSFQLALRSVGQHHCSYRCVCVCVAWMCGTLISTCIEVCGAASLLIQVCVCVCVCVCLCVCGMDVWYTHFSLH